VLADGADRGVRRRMIMKREYDFDGTWTTIPRVRDAPEQGGDGDAIVQGVDGDAICHRGRKRGELTGRVASTCAGR